MPSRDNRIETMSTSNGPETVVIYPRLSYQITTGTGPQQDAEDYLIDLQVKIVAGEARENRG